MTTIVTRIAKGSALTWVEADANFTNLNNDKLEVDGPAASVANTPAGTIVATDVQAALNELDTEKIATSAIGSVGGVQAYDANTAKLNVAQTFVKPQTAGTYSLTSSTAWDGATYQNLSVDVNGSGFTVAAASAAPANGTYVGMEVTYTTTHAVAFTTGASKGFSGMTSFTGTATAGKIDHLIFRYNSTADRFMLVGYAKDCGS